MSMWFVEAATLAFSFLEGAGFRLAHNNADQLQYETAQVRVTIEWDVRSGELDVFVGLQPRNGEARDAFSLTDLLTMDGINLPEQKMPFQVADENKLQPFLDKLAENLRVHAHLALAGDRMFFRRLKAFRTAQAQAYMRDVELRRVRSEADKAWERREFDRLVALYASIENHLTVAEKAKLTYAKGRQS